MSDVEYILMPDEARKWLKKLEEWLELVGKDEIAEPSARYLRRLLEENERLREALQLHMKWMKRIVQLYSNKPSVYSFGKLREDACEKGQAAIALATKEK